MPSIQPLKTQLVRAGRALASPGLCRNNKEDAAYLPSNTQSHETTGRKDAHTLVDDGSGCSCMVSYIFNSKHFVKKNVIKAGVVWGSKCGHTSDAANPS